MKTVYQACDGEIFEHQQEGHNHEAALFDCWLSDLLEGRNGLTVYTVVRHFKDSYHLTCSADAYRGTPGDKLKESLRLYWKDATTALLKHPKRSD